MKTIITKGLHKDEAQELKEIFLSSRRLRKRIVELLDEEIEKTRTEVRSKKNYEVSHWNELVSDSFGYERGLNYIKTLLIEENL